MPGVLGSVFSMKQINKTKGGKGLAQGKKVLALIYQFWKPQEYQFKGRIRVGVR